MALELRNKVFIIQKSILNNFGEIIACVKVSLSNSDSKICVRKMVNDIAGILQWTLIVERLLSLLFADVHNVRITISADTWSVSSTRVSS